MATRKLLTLIPGTTKEPAADRLRSAARKDVGARRANAACRPCIKEAIQ
jgi:hypothetical protein